MKELSFNLKLDNRKWRIQLANVSYVILCLSFLIIAIHLNFIKLNNKQVFILIPLYLSILFFGLLLRDLILFKKNKNSLITFNLQHVIDNKRFLNRSKKIELKNILAIEDYSVTPPTLFTKKILQLKIVVGKEGSNAIMDQLRGDTHYISSYLINSDEFIEFGNRLKYEVAKNKKLH